MNSFDDQKTELLPDSPAQARAANEVCRAENRIQVSADENGDAPPPHSSPAAWSGFSAHISSKEARYVRRCDTYIIHRRRWYFRVTETK